jgi:light-regulated signal transduction histidine kinase (bacteriophytochrome)
LTEIKPSPGRESHLAFYMDLVGHDIINSNQAVLGYLELVLANPNCDRTLRGYAEKAFTHVRTSTMLVENIKRLLATSTCDEASLGPTDLRTVLDRSERDLSRFFPDRTIRVQLGRLPDEIRVLGSAAAKDLMMNAMVSAVRLDPKKEVDLRVMAGPCAFGGKDCWTVSIVGPNALLPPSLRGKDIKSAYRLDSSVAVKLSGLLFSKIIAEILGGDFDAHPLPDAKDDVGAELTITLRRADN